MDELLIIINKITRCRSPPSFLFKTSEEMEVNNVKDKKYFLLVNGKREEVSKEVYTEYWKLKNRENYLRRQDAKFGLLPFSSFDEDGHFVENIPDENVDVEKVVQTKMMIDALNSALEKLTKEDRELIERIYYRDESLRYLAKLKNISHQAMVKRKNRILEKLREFLSDF